MYQISEFERNIRKKVNKENENINKAKGKNIQDMTFNELEKRLYI